MRKKFFRTILMVLIGLVFLLSFFVEASQVEVVDLSWYKKQSPDPVYDEVVVVVGEVLNETEKNLFFRVGATFLTDTGHVQGTGTDNYGFHVRPIRPGEILPFRARLRGDDLQVKEVQINVNTRESYTRGPRKVEVIKTKGAITTYDTENLFKVTGLIRNISDEEASVIMIVGSFYDKEGNIIDVSQGQASIPGPDLQSGETIGFEILASHKVEEIKSYKVVAGS